MASPDFQLRTMTSSPARTMTRSAAAWQTVFRMRSPSPPKKDPGNSVRPASRARWASCDGDGPSGAAMVQVLSQRPGLLTGLDAGQLLLHAPHQLRGQAGVVQRLGELLALVRHPAEEIDHRLSLRGRLVHVDDRPDGAADGVGVLAGRVGQ